MGAVRLTSFGGIVPRTSARLLADNAAQRAANCKLSSGELIPFNAPTNSYSSSKAGKLLSLFRLAEGGSSAWLAWTFDVDVVKAPLFGPPLKWCFTGDAEPRITTLVMATSGGGNAYPNTFYSLGVPKPITAPTVVPSGGAGASVTRFYGYTFYSSWNEEGAVSPLSAETTGRVDDTWTISGMDAAPPNSGAVTASYVAGETEFTDTVNHWLRVGEEVVISSVAMLVTAVTGATKFRVSGDYSAATMWERKAPWNTMSKRLYRTTGTLGTFELVAEGITGTAYNDTLTDAQIPGDELISATWELPPVGLKGLIVLPSGALAGFIGNKLCVSAGNQPHAWPPEYQITVDYGIVGIGPLDSGIAICTESLPYIVTGVEPGQMSASAWNEALPCMSKRSIVSLGDVVLYASAQGYVSVGASGVGIWSLPYFTADEWVDYAPETMVAALSGRRLYLLYTKGGSSRVLVFNLLGDQNYLTEVFVDAHEIYSDQTSGTLYLSFGNGIYEFDPSDGYPLMQDWHSKEIVLPSPACMGAAKVTFEQFINPAVVASIHAEIDAIVAANAAIVAAGSVHGAVNGFAFNSRDYNCSNIYAPPEVPPSNEVTFLYYVGGELKCTKTISNNRPFRLPSGYKADTLSVRVLSQCRINSVEIGATAKDLALA